MDHRDCCVHGVYGDSDNSMDVDGPASSEDSGSEPTPEDVCDLRSTSFKDLVGKLGFVDKTMMIRDFLMDVPNILCLCGPNRFGKTTNMDMVKTFLTIAVDSSGEPIFDAENNENYKLFQNHSLRIYREQRCLFRSACGQYPVIHTDFGKVGGNNKAKILDSMKNIVQQICSDHSYLVKETGPDTWVWRSEALRNSVYKAKSFVAFMKQNPVGKFNEEWVLSGWEYLVDVLHVHFNKPVILLIDNFDSPSLNSVSIHGLKNRETMKWIDKFTKNLILILLERSTVERALLNKVIPVMDDIPMDPEDMLCPLVGEPLGFTETEVNLLLQKPAFKMLNIDDVRRWYGGYRVFCRLEHKVSYVYNPFSVLNLLQKSVQYGEPCFDLYWGDTCPMLKLEKMFMTRSIRNMLWDLLNKGAFSTYLLFSSFNVQMQHIAEMVKFHNTDSSELTPNNVLLLLCLWGYLYETEVEGKKLVSNFYIPNIETRKALALKFMPRLFQMVSTNFPIKMRQLWKYC